MPVYKDEKRGTWFVKMSHVDPVTGKRKQIMKRGFAKKADAQKWESLQRTSQDSTTSTTFENLADLYYAYKKQKPRTVQQQMSMLKHYFPYYSMPIQKVTKAMLVKWHTEFTASDLKPATKNLLITVVKGIYRFGADVYDIKNVASSLTRVKSKKRKYDTWSPAEFDQFISVVDHPVYDACFRFLFWTGIRKSECLNVRYDDFKDGTVHIRGTKTEAADRVLKLPASLLTHLQPILERCTENEPFPFPMASSMLQREFKRYTAIAGVKPIRIHDLRHSFATNTIGSGANILAVSKYLGHSNVQQTLVTYSHMFEEADEALISLIDNINSEKKVS